MIQGGGGQKYACPIKGEFKINGYQNPLDHSRGVISMARTNDPNSQTFLKYQKNRLLNIINEFDF